MSCPTFETLLDFTELRLAPDAVSTIESHVGTGCEPCVSAIEWMQGFATAARADLVEPPTWLTRKAVALFATRQQGGVVAKVTRFVASLVFDSFAGSASPDFVPARSVAGGGRQLLFSAPPYDVDLLVSAGDAPRSLSVSGQILAADSVEFAGVSGLDVAFVRDGVAVFTAVTSEFGEFAVDSLAPGLYDVHVSGPDREIVLSAAPLDVT